MQQVDMNTVIEKERWNGWNVNRDNTKGVAFFVVICW